MTDKSSATDLDPVFDIANFVPSCVVCRTPVPEKRKTGRSKDTCGPECNKILKKYRKHVLQNSKCPTCYHPASPKEREDFRRWRKDRGQVRESRGRPPMKLFQSLAEATQILREYAAPEDHYLAEKLSEFQKILDARSAVS